MYLDNHLNRLEKTMEETMQNQSPIILGNAPSSGSSLLVSIIGTSPNIYQRGEANIFDKPDWIAGRKLGLKKYWKRNRKVNYDIHFPCEHSALFRDFEKVPCFAKTEKTYVEFCCDEMQRLAEISGKLRWVEKTPNNAFSLKFLHDQLPEAKFIVIRRHPASVINSLRRRGYDPVTSVARWYFPNLAVTSLADSGRVFFVKYEDLVEEPIATCRAIFSFIGEDFDESAVHSRQTHGLPQVPSWEKSISGPIENRQNLSPPIPNWAQQEFIEMRANEYFCSYVGLDRSTSPKELADFWGYEVEFTGNPPNILSRRLVFAIRYLRYIASRLKHRQPVRRLWHFWKMDSY